MSTYGSRWKKNDPTLASLLELCAFWRTRVRACLSAAGCADARPPRAGFPPIVVRRGGSAAVIRRASASQRRLHYVLQARRRASAHTFSWHERVRPLIRETKTNGDKPCFRPHTPPPPPGFRAVACGVSLPRNRTEAAQGPLSPLAPFWFACCTEEGAVEEGAISEHHLQPRSDPSTTVLKPIAFNVSQLQCE